MRRWLIFVRTGTHRANRVIPVARSLSLAPPLTPADLIAMVNGLTISFGLETGFLIEAEFGTAVASIIECPLIDLAKALSLACAPSPHCGY